MSVQTKGKCKYCGREYTKGYMLKHFGTCGKRKESLAAETGSKKCGYYELAIYGRYDKAYWLIIEMRDDATLKDLDIFLRDIWLECCGHLSSFEIGGITYDAYPAEGSFWGPPARSMDYKLKTVLQTGMRFSYEYDFGSSTDLVIDVQGYREGYRTKNRLTILSRNIQPEIMCDVCHQKAATAVCVECIYDGDGFLCDDCAKEHECGEEMLLPVCNSPRMGVCAYAGSAAYPEEFVPDCDKE